MADPLLKVTTGFGENLNLFLRDAGIEFEYIRYPWEEWPAIKDDLAVAKGLGHITMPILEINGKVFNKTFPTLRYLSKQLGKCGADHVDCICRSLNLPNREVPWCQR